MITKFENFKIAVDTVEKILTTDVDRAGISSMLREAVGKVEPNEQSKDVLSHMGTLFLNAYLNRPELGSEAINRSTIARGVIAELIQNL